VGILFRCYIYYLLRKNAEFSTKIELSVSGTKQLEGVLMTIFFALGLIASTGLLVSMVVLVIAVEVERNPRDRK
jgi:Gpi18-like mannosyltransferase